MSFLTLCVFCILSHTSDSPQLLQQGKHTPEGSYSPHSTVPCIECACSTWTATTTAGPSTSQHMMLTPMDGGQIGCTLILLVCNISGFVIHLSMENRLSHFTCRCSGNGGPQTCLHAACGVAQVVAQYNPSSSTQAQDPREGPSLAGRMTQGFLRNSLTRQACEEAERSRQGYLARCS